VKLGKMYDRRFSFVDRRTRRRCHVTTTCFCVAQTISRGSWRLKTHVDRIFRYKGCDNDRTGPNLKDRPLIDIIIFYESWQQRVRRKRPELWGDDCLPQDNAPARNALTVKQFLAETRTRSAWLLVVSEIEKPL